MNTCATCQYFRESSCRRYPPTVVGYVETRRDEYSQTSVDTSTNSEFPAVLPTEWCGEWKNDAQNADVFAAIARHHHP